MTSRFSVCEAVATVAGICGAAWLASGAPYPSIGWVCFLISNLAWITFARINRHKGLALQQLAFIATSLLGIYNALQ
jgi:nicotinamide riboside transporter PnuC